MSNETASAALPAGMSANAFSSLFQAVNGLRNQRALVAMIGCTVLGVLVAGLLVAVGGGLGGVLGALVWIVAVGTGVNAAGTLHMDHTRGVAPRSTVDALVYGLMCIPKLIVLGLLLCAIAIAVFIVLAILFFICKIPFLGALLFAVVFPASVVVAGVTFFGLFLCMALSLPAIWQGAPIMRALTQTLAIARSRLVEAVLLLVFVSFLSLAVSLIVFGVLGFGLMPTLGLSASIVGFGGIGGMGGLMGLAQGMGEGGGHVVAGMIGFFVLWAIAVSLVSQVNLLGLCLVYLRVTEGLDLSATEAALRQKFDEARQRASELGDKARTAAHRDGAPVAPASPASPGSAAAMSSGFAAAGAAAATAPPFPPPRPPAAVPPAYPSPAPYTADLPLGGTDIDLPFDDAPAPPEPRPASPSMAPAYSAPPVYMPAPQAPPVAAPAPPAPTTCPQCLSPITAEDVFCGVCGYRVK